MKKLLLAAALSIMYSSGAFAQTTAGFSVPGYLISSGQSAGGVTCTIGPCFVPYGSTLPVSGSFSATLAGFTPTAGATANLTDIVNTSQDIGLPAGTDLDITNKGSVTINLRMQAGAGTAVATDIPLVGGAAVGFHVTTATHLSAIAPTGTGTGTTAGQLNIQGGSGLVTGYGGGSSGGSSSGGNVNVTQIAGTNVDVGAGVTDSGSQRNTVAQDTTTIAGASPTTTGVFVTGPSAAALSTAALQTAGNASLTSIASNMTTATPAGSNIIGKVSQVDSGGTDATDTTNHAVRVNIVAGASSGAVAQGSTTSGQTGGLNQAAVTTSAPTYTTATTNPLSMDTAGALRVNVTSATGIAQGSTSSGQTISPVGMATLTSAPTYTTAQTNMPWLRTNGAQAGDMTSINGTTVSTGTGAQGAGTPRFTVATDSATVAGSASLPAGTNTIGGVTPVAATTGGVTAFTLTAAASTNATNIKASAGTLYHIGVYNNSATLAWVSFYNTAGTPTCGTSIVYQTMIPANSTSGAGAVEDFALGMNFGTGIGICVTTGIAGTGSVAATSYVVGLGYK